MIERVKGLTGSLRFRLPLLVVAVALPAVVLTVWTDIERRHDSAEITRSRALQLARSVAGDYNDSIQSGGDFIRPVAAFLGLFPQEQLDGLANPACSTFFSQFLGPESHYVSFAIAGREGEPICASVEGAGPPEAAPEEFIMQALGTSEPVVSGFRVDPFTGERVVSVAKSITGPAGAVTGVTYASINVNVIDLSAMVDALPSGSFATVTDHDGTIVARYPGGEQFVGTSAANALVFEDILELREGTLEGESLEEVHSLIAFSPVGDADSDAGAFAIVGLPLSEAYGPANAALLRNLLILVGVTGGALILGRIGAQLWIFGPIDRLSRTSGKLAVGELDARVGPSYPPGELGHLSRAFDAMADRMQYRETEVRDLNATLEERVEERTRQLEATNKELESFSYSVSHDLRAPVRAIDGFSRILIEEHSKELSSEARRFLDLIMKSSVNMTRLIDDLLHFSRIGRASMDRRDASLDGVVQDALDEVRQEGNGRAIEFQVSQLGNAHIDPALMRRVFANLLSNSIKFTRNVEPARIEVGRMEQEGRIVYYVKDNGAGFDMKYSDKLFGVFQRLHHVDEFEGTGVGLATAHRVITRHGGQIWAEAAPGNGATFYFSIGQDDQD